MKLEIISREVVTPSSPTPPHLNNYKLSYLDQLAVSLLMPQVVFYSANENHLSDPERSNHLKKSLSKTLTLFYPLAGRLVGNTHVNCNDEGVTYVEALADCNVSDVLTNPLIVEELNRFVPCDPADGGDLCLVVQATFFNCGGLAIGLGMSHKLADAFSYFMFVNSWAANARGDDRIQPPIFESATLFPPRDLGTESGGNKENIVTKRFVFTAERVSMLREKYSRDTNDEGFIRPTRIETLSAFIWTRFMVAIGAKDDARKVYALLMNIDIRTRVVPPLSEKHFGVFILRTFAVPSLEGTAYGLVKKIRDAIRNVDHDYVAKLPERDESLDAVKIRCGLKKDPEGEGVSLRFSSLCRMPIYDADFGWGKPVWVGSGKTPISNVVFFMDSMTSGGIDALVNLKVEDMVKLEADEELKQYVVSGDDSKHMG